MLKHFLSLLSVLFAGVPPPPPYPPPVSPPSYIPPPPSYTPPKNDKKIVVVIVVIVVIFAFLFLTVFVLAPLMYVWTSGLGPSGGGVTPNVILGSASVATGKQDINWSIVGVSRADTKWTDVSATVSLNGTSVSATIYIVIEGTSYDLSSYTGTAYVTAGQAIHVHLGSATGGGAKVDVALVYDPTGGVMGTRSTIVT